MPKNSLAIRLGLWFLVLSIFPLAILAVFVLNDVADGFDALMVKHQREHVTPYFYEGAPADKLRYQDQGSLYSSAITPENHSIALMHHTPDYGDLRWTVDTAEDLDLVRRIVSNFPDDTFSWLDVLNLIQNQPELTQINAQVTHKTHLDIDFRSIE